MEGRRYHGCGHYQNDLGEKTLLVTGGLYEDGGQMNLRASTELLGETSEVWRLAGELPSPTATLSGINIQSRLFMTGREKTLTHT